MKTFFTIGICVSILLIFVGTSFIPTASHNNTIFDGELRSLSIGSAVIDVAIADTQITRGVGLSYLKTLREDHGLFFVFRDSATHGMWMKNMEFPIDIIWLDEQLRVVEIHRDVSPDSYPETFRTKVPTRFALEVNAGFSLKHDVNIGSVSVFRVY